MTGEALIGSWELVDFRFIGADGVARNPYAPETAGLLIYSADHFMSVAINFVDADGTAKPMFYAGPLEINDGHNVHHIEFANDPTVIGTRQRRTVTFDGDHMILTNADSLVGGTGVRAEITWRRHR